MIRKPTHRWSLLLLISILGSCTHQKEAEAPDDLVPPEKMISFLVDLHLAEAKMSYGDVRDPDSLEIVYRNYERYLFDKYAIEDSTYYQSYKYYLSNMDQLHEIYGAVVDSLSVLNSIEKNKDYGISDPDSNNLQN